MNVIFIWAVFYPEYKKDSADKDLNTKRFPESGNFEGLVSGCIFMSRKIMVAQKQPIKNPKLQGLTEMLRRQKIRKINCFLWWIMFIFVTKIQFLENFEKSFIQNINLKIIISVQSQEKDAFKVSKWWKGYISIEKGTFREIRAVYQICKNSRWVTLVSCCVNFLRIYIFIFIRLWRCSLILSCLKSPDHPNRFFFPALSKMASHRALLRFCDKLSARHLQKTRGDF